MGDRRGQGRAEGRLGVAGVCRGVAHIRFQGDGQAPAVVAARAGQTAIIGQLKRKLRVLVPVAV